MAKKRVIRAFGKGIAYGIGAGAGAYAVYAAATYLRYGRASLPRDGKDQDPLLDRFMPSYEIAERHHISVAAPPEIAFAAACDVDLQRSTIVRGIFRARELVLGSRPDSVDRPRGLLAFTKSLGWGVLAEVPDREVVMGAVTRPWEANPTFQTIRPDQFATFDEPHFVKIVWTLRVDATGARESVVHTETRVAATDSTAREQFRPYWALASPGILLIRRIALGLVKAEAERRARQQEHLTSSADRFDLASGGDLDPQC